MSIDCSKSLNPLKIDITQISAATPTAIPRSEIPEMIVIKFTLRREVRMYLSANRSDKGIDELIARWINIFQMAIYHIAVEKLAGESSLVDILWAIRLGATPQAIVCKASESRIKRIKGFHGLIAPKN